MTLAAAESLSVPDPLAALDDGNDPVAASRGARHSYPLPVFLLSSLRRSTVADSRSHGRSKRCCALGCGRSIGPDAEVLVLHGLMGQVYWTILMLLVSTFDLNPRCN